MMRPGITFLILFAMVSTLTAQSNDAQLWSWLSVDKKITKNMTGVLEQQVRLSQNMSFPKNIFTEVGVAYRISKAIKYTLYYRFMNRGQTTGGYIIGNRIAGDLRLRYKKKPFVLSYRNRIQREYRVNPADDNSENLGEVTFRQISYVRNKLAVALDLDKKFTPYFSFELYYHLDDGEFNKNRYTLGVNFNLKKRNELDLFYRLQDEYNGNNPVRAYVFGIGFHHSLKGRLVKKKKKEKA